MRAQGSSFTRLLQVLCRQTACCGNEDGDLIRASPFFAILHSAGVVLGFHFFLKRCTSHVCGLCCHDWLGWAQMVFRPACRCRKDCFHASPRSSMRAAKPLLCTPHVLAGYLLHLTDPGLVSADSLRRQGGQRLDSVLLLFPLAYVWTNSKYGGFYFVT